MSEERFDAIIIGSGQAGNPLAVAMAQHAWHVAMVEREHIGGTCVNVGCTPTKTLVATARVAYLSRRSEDFGIFTGAEVRADMSAVIQRKRTLVAKSNHSGRKHLEEQDKIELVFGEGSFSATKADAGLHAIDVRSAHGGERRLIAPRVFLDTGQRPAVPEIDGLRSVPFLDNASIMELDVLPDHLIVLGGGVIAVEFAQMFRRFGSRVTMVERSDRLLAHEDEDVSACVEQIFREDEIDLRLNAKIKNVAMDGDDVVFTLADGELRGTHLLVATGREPNVESLKLGRAGVALDTEGYIAVNDKLETNVAGVWALGDVNGGPPFTHVAYDDYRVVRANVLDDKQRSRAGRIATYCIFTDPEVGRVGMTESEARNSGRKLLMASLPMTYMARANEMAEARGMLKAIVDADTEEILGAAVIGVDGGEVAAQIQIAMMGKLPYTALRDGVFAHPTRAEVLNVLFGSLKPANE